MEEGLRALIAIKFWGPVCDSLHNVFISLKGNKGTWTPVPDMNRARTHPNFLSLGFMLSYD